MLISDEDGPPSSPPTISFSAQPSPLPTLPTPISPLPAPLPSLPPLPPQLLMQPMPVLGPLDVVARLQAFPQHATGEQCQAAWNEMLPRVEGRPHLPMVEQLDEDLAAANFRYERRFAVLVRERELCRLRAAMYRRQIDLLNQILSNE